MQLCINYAILLQRSHEEHTEENDFSFFDRALKFGRKKQAQN